MMPEGRVGFSSMTLLLSRAESFKNLFKDLAWENL